MTSQQKAKKILLLLTLFSLSLLIVAPFACGALAYPNKASLLPTTISATQTPGSISTGKTWTYRFTYRNSTFTGSFTYTQQNGGEVSIADLNFSVQQCYKFVTTIDVIQFWTALGDPSALGPDISSDIQILSVYLKTTDYSIPRMDVLEVFGYTNGTSSQKFDSSLLDFTVNLYKFPISNGQSWTSTANSIVSGWTVNASGYNQTSGPTPGPLPYIVNALVSGPTSVIVPAGSYQAYQINYTAIPLWLLFGGPGVWPLSLGLTSVQCWYSLDAQNFVKCFLDYGSGTNVTAELLSIYNPLQTMLFLTFYNTLQQQSFFKLLLIGGGIGAVIIIAGIAIAIHRRRG